MATGRTKARAAGLALLLTLTADPPAPTSAQMLWNHEEWRYVNYARQGVPALHRRRLVRAAEACLRRARQLPDAGGAGLSHEEARENDPLAGSLVDESVEYRINLNRLVIGHDSYGDRSSRIMVGDFIRTKFSALTLDLASLNGVRWDIDLTPRRSPSCRRAWTGPSSLGEAAGADRPRQRGPPGAPLVVLPPGRPRGAPLRRHEPGFNYVNLHRTDSLVDWGDNNIRGVLPSAVNRPPAWIAVRVNDGSDDDEEGARVHEVSIKNPELAHVVAAVTLPRHGGDRPVLSERRSVLPPGTPHPAVRAVPEGEFPPAQRRPEGYYQADGTEYLIFWSRSRKSSGTRSRRSNSRPWYPTTTTSSCRRSSSPSAARHQATPPSAASGLPTTIP